jgi:hypothetical protein
MKFIAIFALLATTALAIPAAKPIEGVRETPLEVRELLEARQVTCACIGGELCCVYFCNSDPDC